MGVIAKIALQLVAVAIMLAVGYFFPSALANMLTWLDAMLARAAETAEPTGTMKLILQFAGAGFALLMTIFVIGLGFVLRQFVSEKLFRWRYVLTAGLIPLLAHVVKWGLGIIWPALLVPVHTLTGVIYNWFSPETQIRLDLFNFKGHLMTIIIGFMLVLLWSLATFLWRRFRGRKAPISKPISQSQPLTTRGSKGNVMKKKLYSGWLLLTRPFRDDWIFGPIFWFIIQIALAALLTYVVWVLLDPLGSWIASQSNLTTNPLNGQVRVWVAAICFVLLVFPSLKPETNAAGEITGWKLDIYKIEKANRGVQLTWIGIVIPVILKTGIYPLFGGRYGFGRLLISSETIAENGLYVLSDITFQVWQSPSAETKEQKTTITLQAGNGAAVRGNLSLILGGKRRVKWEGAGDGGLQLGNRARQELQEILEQFNDSDVRAVQGVMSRLMLGEKMVTVFTSEEVEGRQVRSMMRDVNGKPLYVFIEDTNKKTEEEAQALLRDAIEVRGDKKMKETLHKGPDGKIITVLVKAEHGVAEVVERLGHELLQIIYDSVFQSEEVEQVANRASSEEKQRLIQMASARTAKAAAMELELSPKEKENLSPVELAAMLENQRIKLAIDSQNGNFKVVQLTGGANQRLKDLVAANTINDKGTK